MARQSALSNASDHLLHLSALPCLLEIGGVLSSCCLKRISLALGHTGCAACQKAHEQSKLAKHECVFGCSLESVPSLGNSPGPYLLVCFARRFRLLNQRSNLVFMLFSNISRDANFSSAEMVATSNILRLRNPNEPTQGHLVLAAGARWVSACLHLAQVLGGFVVTVNGCLLRLLGYAGKP